jgi:hypothetical protein
MPAPNILSLKIGLPKEAFRRASAKGAVNRALHEHSDELASFELTNIRNRTPRRFGALRESAGATAYKNPSDRRLAQLYYDDEPQLFEWGRVYSVYQEGEPMGLSTYTNPPHQMLYHVGDEDASQIEEWAARVSQTALDEWTAGAQSEAGN